jgi:hypothetical protein
VASKVAEPSLLFDWPCWPDQHAVPSYSSLLCLASWWKMAGGQGKSVKQWAYAFPSLVHCCSSILVHCFLTLDGWISVRLLSTLNNSLYSFWWDVTNDLAVTSCNLSLNPNVLAAILCLTYSFSPQCRSMMYPSSALPYMPLPTSSCITAPTFSGHACASVWSLSTSPIPTFHIYQLSPPYHVEHQAIEPPACESTGRRLVLHLLGYSHWACAKMGVGVVRIA